VATADKSNDVHKSSDVDSSNDSSVKADDDVHKASTHNNIKTYGEEDNHKSKSEEPKE